MHNHLKLAAVIAAACIGDLYFMRKLKTTNHEINEINKILGDMVVESEQRVVYLSTVLAAHDITLDEFDMIALNFNTEE